MNEVQLAEKISSLMDSERDDLISASRSRVESYIADQGSECLTLIEHASGETKVWKLGADPRYIARLGAFCVNKPPTYGGNQLDSVLTAPVVGIVTEEFERAYDRRSEDLDRAVRAHLLSDEDFARSILGQLINNSAAKKISSEVRAMVMDLAIERIKEEASGASVNAISDKVATTVAAVAAKPIATKIAILVTKAIAMNSKVVIAKVVASKAAKVAIAAATKKFVAAAVVASVAKLFAAKFGIAVGGAATILLVPIIGAYIFYEVATFPKHLGAKVAESLASELHGGYGTINREIGEALAQSLLDFGASKMGEAIGESDEFQAQIAKLLATHS